MYSSLLNIILTLITLVSLTLIIYISTNGSYTLELKIPRVINWFFEKLIGPLEFSINAQGFLLAIFIIILLGYLAAMSSNSYRGKLLMGVFSTIISYFLSTIAYFFLTNTNFNSYSAILFKINKIFSLSDKIDLYKNEYHKLIDITIAKVGNSSTYKTALLEFKNNLRNCTFNLQSDVFSTLSENEIRSQAIKDSTSKINELIKTVDSINQYQLTLDQNINSKWVYVGGLLLIGLVIGVFYNSVAVGNLKSAVIEQIDSSSLIRSVTGGLGKAIDSCFSANSALFKEIEQVTQHFDNALFEINERILKIDEQIAMTANQLNILPIPTPTPTPTPEFTEIISQVLTNPEIVTLQTELTTALAKISLLTVCLGGICNNLPFLLSELIQKCL